MTDLVKRLREVPKSVHDFHHLREEAADLIEQQQAEIERLRKENELWVPRPKAETAATKEEG